MLKAGRSRAAVLLLTIAGMLASLVPNASAAITAPVTTPGGATEVFGGVPINDPYVATTNTARPCTITSTSGNTSKGVTKVEIFQGDTATGTPVLANNFTSHAKGTLLFVFPYEVFGLTGTLAPTWATDTTTNGIVPRGHYTIKTSYFQRLANTGACNAAANCTTSPTFGTLSVIGSGNVLGCAPANTVGPQDNSQPVSTVTVDVQNRQSLAITNAPATGFLITDSSPTTTQTVTARLTDPGQANAGVNGNTLTFTLAGGPSGDDVKTAVTAGTGTAAGTASVVFDVAGWSFGTHALTVSATQPNPTFFKPTANAVSSIKYGGNSKTTYTGPNTVFWNESIVATSHTEALAAGGGVPTDGQVRFTVGTQTPVLANVDTSGNASATIPITMNPPSTTIKADYLPSADSAFLNSTSPSVTITVNKRPTTLVYDGASDVRWGDPVTLGATLTDTRLTTPGHPAPLANKMITFHIGDQTATATTDINGHASKVVNVSSDVGSQPASASFAGDTQYVASTSPTVSVRIDERYVFQDVNSPGYIGLNPATRQFKYNNPVASTGTGDRRAPLMLSIFLPTNLVYPGLPALPVIPNDPLGNLNNLPVLSPTISIENINNLIAFLLGLIPPTSELSSTSSSGSTSSLASTGSSSSSLADFTPQPDDVATNPVQIGGFTIGELIAKLSSGNLPSDIDTCQLLTGSTCERRLVVLVYPTTDSLTNVGVFDIRTGLFLSLNSWWADGTKLMYNLGGCTNLQTCLRLPVTPSGLPDLLSAVPGLPEIPLDLGPIPAIPAGDLNLPLSGLPPLGDFAVPTDLLDTGGLPLIPDPTSTIGDLTAQLGLGELPIPVPDLGDPLGALTDLGLPLGDLALPLGSVPLPAIPDVGVPLSDLALPDLGATLAPFTAALPPTVNAPINDALTALSLGDPAGAIGAGLDATLGAAGLGGIPSLSSIPITETLAPVVEPLKEGLNPVLEQLGLPTVGLSSTESSTASDSSTAAALEVPDLSATLAPVNDALGSVNDALGSDTIPELAVPSLPASLPNSDELVALIMAQVNQAAIDAQTTPDKILNLVQDFYVPTPAEAGTYVTGTLQQLIDRITGTVAFGGDNSGILGLPEFAIGEITHLVVSIKSNACVSGGTTAVPDASNWKNLTESCAPVGTMIDVVQSCTDPLLKRGQAGCVAPRRPFEYHENNTIAHYTVSRSPYVPAVPGIIGLNPLILALPIAIGLSPVDVPGPVLDLVQPLAAAPLLLTTVGASKLLNIQGKGWTDAEGSHGAGNQIVGQSLDLAPKPTTAADPFPFYVPFYNGSILSAVRDHAIDFIGFGEPTSNTHTCLNTFEKETQVDGKWMSTFRGGSGFALGTAWVNLLGLCTSALVMATSAGVAVFNGSPVNFRTDLAPLWSPAPPGADVAVALIVNVLEGVLPDDLLTTLLGSVPAIPAIPEVPVPDTGLASTGTASAQPQPAAPLPNLVGAVKGVTNKLLGK